MRGRRSLTVSVYEHGKLVRRKTDYSHDATSTGIVLVGNGTASGGN
jgi:hypothetical protein